MVVLDESYTDQNLFFVRAKVEAILSTFNKNAEFAEDRLQDKSNYALMYRSLSGGYSILSIPTVSVSGSFVDQLTAVKKSIVCAELANKNSKVNDEQMREFILNFVNSFYSMGDDARQNINNKKAAVIIWGFLVGFSNFFADEVFLDNKNRIVFIDTSLYGFIVQQTDEWVSHIMRNDGASSMSSKTLH